MLTLSWWAYFLILSVGAGVLALALLFLFCKCGSVLFSPEVDAEFHCMACSAWIVHLQHLVDQRAQEIACTSCTTPEVGPLIELQPIITIPSPTHSSPHQPNRVKCQGCIFTLIDFNLHNLSHSQILPSTNYVIPPAPTYPAPNPLCPDLPMLGELHQASTSYLQPPGLCNEPSRSMIASEMTMTSQVTLLSSRFLFDLLRAVNFLSEEDSDGTH